MRQKISSFAKLSGQFFCLRRDQHNGRQSRVNELCYLRFTEAQLVHVQTCLSQAFVFQIFKDKFQPSTFIQI